MIRQFKFIQQIKIHFYNLKTTNYREFSINSTLSNKDKSANTPIEPENTKKENEKTHQPPKNSFENLKKIKDLTSFLVYGAFAFVIYKAYKEFKKTDEFKKEVQASLINIANFKHKFYQIKDFIIPEFMVSKLPNFKEFNSKNSDVWISSFPKSGTTWVQELVYLIVNDCDFIKAKSKSIEERSPFLEYPMPGLKFIEKMNSPRVIKTHLPYNFLPDDIENKSKVIYILRNPKDVSISYFYFINMSLEAGFNGDLEDIISLFMQGKIPYGPWWAHVDGFTSKKNVHIIHYEDLQKNPEVELKRLCKFLGKELNDQKIKELIDWCSFENMKNNPTVNYEWNKSLGLYRKDGAFFRKGKIGDWINHFTPTLSIQFDEIINKNLKYEKQLDYGVSKEDLEKIYSIKPSTPKKK